MRICLVSRESYPFVGGGIATYIAELGRALVAAGHETHVLTAPYPNLEARGRDAVPGVMFHAVDTARPASLVPGAFAAESAEYALATHLTLRELHERHPFDYIEFPEYGGGGYFALRAKRSGTGYGAALMGVRLHTPSYVCRQFDGLDWYSTEIAQVEVMEQASARDADLLLSASRAMLKRVQEDLAKSSPRTSVSERADAVLPLPLQASTFQRRRGRADSEPPPRGTREVLYFGRMQLVKGVTELIEAGKRLLDEGHDLHFRLVGADTATRRLPRPVHSAVRCSNTLRALAAGPHRGRFHFQPPCPREQLAELVHHAAVCCFPSRWESFSMACLEALAMGAVVVGGNAGGIGEIIEDEVSGLLVPPGDSGALARTLVRASRRCPASAEAAGKTPRFVRSRSAIRPRIVQALEDLIRITPRQRPERSLDVSADQTPRVSVGDSVERSERVAPRHARLDRSAGRSAMSKSFLSSVVPPAAITRGCSPGLSIPPALQAVFRFESSVGPA